MLGLRVFARVDGLRLPGLVGVFHGQCGCLRVRRDDHAALVRGVGRNRRGVDGRRAAVIVRRNSTRFAAFCSLGVGVFRNHGAAVFDFLRRQGHFARRRVNGHVFRQGVFRCPLAARVFGYGDGLRLAGLVGVAHAQCARLRVRRDGHAALMVGIGRDGRRVDRLRVRIGVRVRRGGAVVGDGDGTRFAGVAAGIGYGVLHRRRVAGEAVVRSKAYFAARHDFPGAFARDFQRRHLVARGRVNQFDGGRVNGVVALFVGVVGENVNGNRLAFRAFHAVGIGDRRVIARLWLRVRRGDGIVRRGHACVRTGVGAVAVVCLDGAAVFDFLRRQRHFARRRVNVHVFRQGAFRRPFAACVFFYRDGVGLSLFVGVVDGQGFCLVVRGDNDSALVRGIGNHGRRINGRRGGAGFVVGDNTGVSAGIGAIAIVCLDGAAVFHRFWFQRHFAAGRIYGHAGRQRAFRCPFAARVLVHRHGVRLSLFVGVVNGQGVRLAVRADGHATFVRGVFGDYRRLNGLRVRIGIWRRRRAVVIVSDDARIGTGVGAVAVFRGYG